MGNNPNNPTAWDLAWCSDEDICVFCSADFATLLPKDQVLAQGTDGVFLSSDLWTMHSASVNFPANGAAVGNIVQLLGPAPTFKGSGVKMAVSSVQPNQVTLRQVGQNIGLGQPPGPAAGITGVSFLVGTFGPQIEYASYEIALRFGIDPTFALIAPGQLYDPRELQQVSVLSVVVKAYRTDSRSKDGDFKDKLKAYENELNDQLARCNMKWNTITGENPQPTTRFNTRLGR